MNENNTNCIPFRLQNCEIKINTGITNRYIRQINQKTVLIFLILGCKAWLSDNGLVCFTESLVMHQLLVEIGVGLFSKL